MTTTLSLQKKLLRIAIVCVLVSFIFKLITVADYSFQFWYDQARDAILSSEILLNHDLKIQGPSASGTNDTIYHGVWYYYLIAPWYVLGQGDPMVPTVFMALLTSIGVGLFVWLLFELSQSLRAALIGGLLAAVSLEVAELGVYLANPSIAIPGLLLLYLSLWKIFYQRVVTYRWVIAVGFALGLCTQAAVWLIYLWGPVVVGFVWFLYSSKEKTWFLLQRYWKKIGVVLLVYLLCISSMLVAQVKLWRAGIFSISQLTEATQEHQTSIISHVPAIISLYSDKVEHTLLFGTLSVIVLFVITMLVLRKLNAKTNIFILSIWTAPLWLLLWHDRTTYHLLLGLEFIIVMIVSFFLAQVSRKNKWLVGCILIGWVVLQSSVLLQHRAARATTFSLNGAPFLRDQLDLIDTAYREAHPCSYATLTVPYAYNTTWTYLFHWNGQSNHRSPPRYMGFDQTNIAGQDLVTSTDSACDSHLSIIETTAPLDDFFLRAYNGTQAEKAPVVMQEFSFPGLQLELRTPASESAGIES